MREDGRVFEWEAEFYRKDGSRIWTSTNARAVRDPPPASCSATRARSRT
jgi:hypothetical protein